MSSQNQGGESVTIGAADIGVLTLADPHAPHAKAGSKLIVDHPIFCAQCQAIKAHKTSVIQDRNGHREIVATCDCGRALKFPLTDDPAHWVAMLDAHHKANIGQVTVEAADTEREAYDARFRKMLGIA